MQAPEGLPILALGQVFTLLFVTLGPLKLLGPFMQLTHDVPTAAMKQIAVRAFTFALIAVVAGAFLGRALLAGWNISVPTLVLAGGVIFALVGLDLVLEQYQPVHLAPPPLPDRPTAAAMRITFPLVVTPYGVAALIVLLAQSHSTSRTVAILGILVAVMVLDLIAMLYARRIMEGMTVIVFQILGAVLGVLQVALALEMILYGLRELGVIER